MAGSTAVADQPFHVRSISMPSRAHPLAIRAEDEQHKLRTCVASSAYSMAPQVLCNALQGLGDLYDCVEELLRLPCNQQAIHHPHQKKWVEAELNASVRLLDLCDASRDNLVAAKEHIQDLRSSLRRNGAAFENKVHDYICSRKKAEKDIKNCFRSLKQIGSTSGSTNSPALDTDCDLSLVVTMLIEAREITISLLRSISSLLSMTRRRRNAGRWSFVSKALQKRKVASDLQHEDGIEVDSVDHVSFYALYECVSCKDANDGRVQNAQHQLQALEASIEGLETGLECLFRRLIQNRVSLLNILSL